MRLPPLEVELYRNISARHGAYDDVRRAVLSLAEHDVARATISSWPNYQPTPLHSLEGLAATLGIGGLWLKDESSRFGLGAFKSIGGAYAVLRLLERLGARDRAHEVTVACASAGNHGRAVAFGAKLFGCNCVVYLNEAVTPGRVAAIEGLGARVVRTTGSYDDAVRRVDADAAREGWYVVSDTAYDGYTDIPRDVMQGYTVLVEEALEQLEQPPTHVFVQAGVGGFAAAVCAHLWERYGAERPIIVVVEPRNAACVTASLAADRLVPLPDVQSIMGGLCCGEVSLLAFDFLHNCADYLITIPDEAVAPTMRLLKHGMNGDPSIISGESGVAGIAALIGACARDEFDHGVELYSQSRVLVFSTEGATDPESYARLTADA